MAHTATIRCQRLSLQTLDQATLNGHHHLVLIDCQGCHRPHSSSIARLVQLLAGQQQAGPERYRVRLLNQSSQLQKLWAILGLQHLLPAGSIAA